VTRRAVLLTAAVFLFSVQAISSRFLRREPYLPSPPPLASLPPQLGVWSQVKEESVEPDALNILGPDDFLARAYRRSGDAGQADLFIAYYKTQLQDKNAHDPKVCLPGSGWNPTASRLDRVPLGAGKSFPANYYRIKRDDNEQVVLYWFQTFSGVYTFEQQLKAHRVWDAIVDNRTDMALVRIVVPLTPEGAQPAEDRALQLAESVYTQMLSHFPPTEKSGS
jgi:EpsI family protein